MKPVGWLKGKINWICICIWFALLIFPNTLYSSELCSELLAGKIFTDCKRIGVGNLTECILKGVINAPPDQVWNLIINDEKICKFMPRLLKSQVLQPESITRLKAIKEPKAADEIEALLADCFTHSTDFRVPGQIYTLYLYERIDLPWPFKDRWYVVRITRDERQAIKRVYVARWFLEAGNLSENRGQWKLEPLGENRTIVTYHMITDPGVNLPRYIVNKGMYHTLPEIINGLRKGVSQAE